MPQPMQLLLSVRQLRLLLLLSMLLVLPAMQLLLLPNQQVLCRSAMMASVMP